MPAAKPSSGRSAALVAAGILLSRLVGLVRQRLFAHYLGTSVAAAAFSAALRIPNFLQNLLGEGTLSASFIPVYSGLRAQKKDDEADRVAGAVFGLLGLAVAVLATLGVLGADLFVSLIAPGFKGESRELTTSLVRILFPATAVLVMSAWCLGILNSHRKFFLAYAAPVLWNGCIIASLVIFGGRVPPEELARWAAIGTVAGGVAQFLSQLPSVLKVLGRFRPSLGRDGASREVLKGFGPAVLTRGVVQISAWVDTAWASLITERAVAALTAAQTISLLPVSLFGMAITAAELPEMSAEAAGGGEERIKALRERLQAALARLSFFVVPSSVAFVLLGDQLSGLLLQSGRFTAKDSRFVWYLLIAAAVGLTAQTSGRVYASAFWALKDTRTPFRFAVARITLSAGLGYLAAGFLPTWLGVPRELGAAFLTAASGACGWVEFLLLRWALGVKINGLPTTSSVKIWFCALAAGAAGLVTKMALTARYGPNSSTLEEWGGEFFPAPNFSPVLTAVFGVSAFGAVYFLTSLATKNPQATALMRGVARRFGRR